MLLALADQAKNINTATAKSDFITNDSHTYKETAR